MINVLENDTCLDILKTNYVGRLAYICKGEPYVTPITYYYKQSDHCIVSYSVEGHKIKSMRLNQYVSLEVDEITSVNRWRSVLVHGLFEELHQIDAKYVLHEFCEGVKKVINIRDKENPHFISEFSAKLEGQGTPIVFRIQIQEITGKQRMG